MKPKALFILCSSLSIVCLSPMPVLAGSQRYLTNAEVQQAMRKFRQMIPELRQSVQFGGSGGRQRSLDSFVQAWSRVDPAAAPFLGTWHGQETDWNFYPSRVKGRVCIIFRSPTFDGDSTHASFGLGYALNGQLRTNEVTTLVGREHFVFLRQENYLGIASVNTTGVGVFPYSASSDPLQSVSQLLSYSSPSVRANIIRQFNAAGCTASRPKAR